MDVIGHKVLLLNVKLRLRADRAEVLVAHPLGFVLVVFAALLLVRRPLVLRTDPDAGLKKTQSSAIDCLG